MTLLFCLCTITLTQAQRYEVDCLVSSEIKAVATDKPTEFDGTRTVLYLRNGTLVNVVGRKVPEPTDRKPRISSRPVTRSM